MITGSGMVIKISYLQLAVCQKIVAVPTSDAWSYHRCSGKYAPGGNRGMDERCALPDPAG